MKEEIMNIVEDSGFEYFGIRIEDEVVYSVGDIANESRVWDNGDPTEETLDGTSCIGFSDDEKSFDRALEIAKQYYGTNVYVIAGNCMEYGEDVGEYIIQDAEVIAKM